MKVYSLSNCDTCRKAVKALRFAHDELSVTDIRKDGMSAEEIAQVVEAVGWELAVNRRSPTWRGLSEGDKTDLDNAKAARLIAEHPTLMKRPAIVDGETVTVGWTPDVQAGWLK